MAENDSKGQQQAYNAKVTLIVDSHGNVQTKIDISSVTSPQLNGIPNNSRQKSPSLPVGRPQQSDTLLHLRGTKKRFMLGMVGLPARGKTYIAKKLTRFLNWLGYKTRLFNIGEYRRKIVGAEKQSDFFDPDNKEAVTVRETMALAALEDMFTFFKNGGQAAIYDGTNSTVSRRKMVCEYIQQHSGDMEIELVWIESICNDQSIIEANIRATKLFSPDYVKAKADEAFSDFRSRIQMYEKAYEPLDEYRDGSFVKLIDCGKEVIVNRIQGYLPGRIVFFLMNLRINKDPIYLTRHGESEFNVEGRTGGNSSLTQQGKEFGKGLAKLILEQPEVKGKVLHIWCSTLRRAVETANEFDQEQQCEIVQWRALAEIHVGICDTMTYEEIEAKYPDEFKARQKDKLNYRYPQGESYVDVISRLEPVIFELERIKEPVVVIGHRAVMRCLYAYFLDKAPEEIPYLDVPLHTVIKLTPKAYSCEETRIPIPITCTVDAKRDRQLT